MGIRFLGAFAIVLALSAPFYASAGGVLPPPPDTAKAPAPSAPPSEHLSTASSTLPAELQERGAAPSTPVHNTMVAISSDPLVLWEVALLFVLVIGFGIFFTGKERKKRHHHHEH